MNCTVEKARKLKAKMEKDISIILRNFESATGLKPGVVFSERLNVIHHVSDRPAQPFKYKVNIPVHL